MNWIRHVSAGGRWQQVRVILAVLALAGLIGGLAWAASEPAAAASHLSDQAFAFLNSISGSGSNPLVGPVAGFAGDAQTLATALKRGDQSGAASAMASLAADRAAVDGALSAHPDAAAASRWRALKSALDSLAAEVKPNVAVSTAGPPAVDTAASGPSSGASAPPSGLAASAASLNGGPQVAITSRTREGGALQVKGWFAGTNLKSAGIYSGRHRLQALHLDRIVGEQRVNFDLKLTGVQPGMVLRVYDQNGRSSEAMLESPAEVASASGVEVMRGDSPASAGADTGTAVAAPSLESSNTAVIPSAIPARPPNYNPGVLAGVQINLLSVNQVSAIPRRYEVTGQIVGSGVRRAGVYVDGRLAQTIPISRGSGAISFDTTFQMLGSEATIRAYGVGGNFVETSVDLGSAGSAPLYGTTPLVVNPYVYGANPYVYGASPYANPYAGNPYPYGNPYANPYGYNNPYGYRSPYGYGYGGYGNGYPPPNMPWWQRLLP